MFCLKPTQLWNWLEVRIHLILILSSFHVSILDWQNLLLILAKGNSSKWSRQSKISLFPLANERARCEAELVQSAVTTISQNSLGQQPPGEIHPRGEGRARCSVFSLCILMTPGSVDCSDYHGRSLIMMTRAEYIVYTQNIIHTITTIQSHDTS